MRVPVAGRTDVFLLDVPASRAKLVRDLAAMLAKP